MKKNYLLPEKFKIIVWILLVPFLILGFYVLVYDSEPSFFDAKVVSLFDQNSSTIGDKSQNFHWISIRKNNIFNEIVMVGLLISLWFVAFSKEKIEDEFIKKIRLESLVWATYFNLFILIFAVLFIYEFNFFLVMELNIFTLLIFFIIRFNLKLKKLSKTSNYEE